MLRRLVLLVVALAVFASAGAGAEAPQPLLGANSIEYTGGDPPNCFGASILYDYGQARVRALVRQQLAAMRAAGLESLRVFFVFDDNTSENPYFIPARSGKLEEPFRANLITYLSDIKAAHFQRVTLAIDPRYSTDPAARFGRYEPATLDETWGLISDTRPLLKQYGPAETRVDLLNEGAPPPTGADDEVRYIQTMYTSYVEAFGADDVTVSAGFWVGLDRLVAVFRSTGKPLPQWFDIHPQYDYASTLGLLRQTDADLTALGLAQPLVIGEEKYNDGDVARAIADFAHSSSRRVDEVMEWPADANGIGAGSRCISPPYRVDAYSSALRATAPSNRLAATVTDRGVSFRTPYGDPVTALEAGTYVVAVTDASRRRGFVLDRYHTATRWRGRVNWRVILGAGDHIFGSVGRPTTSRRFSVLTPG